ncbi:MAG: helix-turn-helix domain-containing protein [Rikenellaceae bacterium]
MSRTKEQVLSSTLEAKVELLKVKLNQLKVKSSDLNLREKIKSDEVCELLNINSRTLKKLREKRLISFIQVGRKIYFRQADVECYLKKIEEYYE